MTAYKPQKWADAKSRIGFLEAHCDVIEKRCTDAEARVAELERELESVEAALEIETDSSDALLEQSIKNAVERDQARDRILAITREKKDSNDSHFAIGLIDGVIVGTALGFLATALVMKIFGAH